MVNESISTDDFNAALIAVNAIKSRIGTIFVVGIGNSNSNNTGSAMATSPLSYVQIPTYSALSGATHSMSKLKCVAPLVANCSVELNQLIDFFNACTCSCDQQSQILQVYVLVAVSIATMRTARASMEAIKNQMRGEGTPRASHPSFGGKREHAITFLTIVLFVLSVAFFWGECPSHWTETYMLAVASGIIFLQLIPWVYAVVTNPWESLTHMPLVMCSALYHTFCCCCMKSAMENASPAKSSESKSDSKSKELD